MRTKRLWKLNFYAVKKFNPVGLKFPLTFLSGFKEIFFFQTKDKNNVEFSPLC